MLALVMVFTMVIGTEGLTLTAKADGGPTLKLHYHREDGNYDGWDVWLWPEGGEGAGYAFEEENGEMVATMEVEPGVSTVGFIVRTQDWTKDVNMDQFIDLSEVVTGTVHAYVESGVEGYTKEYGDDIVTGTKLKTARYNGDSTITITLTGEMSDTQMDSIYIIGRQGYADIKDIEDLGDYQYLITLETELDMAKSYRINFEDTEYSVNMPIIYSTEEFESQYTYTGDDLGAVYSPASTAFRVWSPTAEEMYLNLYESGNTRNDDLKEQIAMTKDVNGTWVATVEGDLNGTYYTYTAIQDGLKNEVVDPYARTTGVNGKRGMVIDLDSTDPEGWENDSNPHAGETINDAVIYELHIRDLSSDSSSGIEHTGKYLGLTETGTTTAGGSATGLDHIKNLGVTHVHLLPFYDFGSVDETYTSQNLFNWGYDPVNYNVPEGSYSTDPFNGEVRVAEVKQMVQAMHNNGLSVVMDVVYNHVYSAADFSINRLVPGYFSRINEDGTYSNGSGCGNDTATERSMVHKFIVDSVCYWADEYHIDGFRFDLVGLMDTDVINDIVESVHETHPDVIFYGEGWSLGTNVTKEGYTLATQAASAQTPGFAYFNDNIRDGLKGSVFNTSETGYVSGSMNKEYSMQVSFRANEVWASSPSQVIQYASCHDNNTLFDRLAVSRPDADRKDLIRMNNLAAAFYLTAEGVPFFQAGEEMLRSKVKSDGTYDSNSYSSGDKVNSLKWDTLDDPEYQKVLAYYQGLIAFRKAHNVLRLTSEDLVSAAISDLADLDANVVGFLVDGTQAKDETAESMILLFNPNANTTTVNLPEGNWNIYVNDEVAGTTAIRSVSGDVVVNPISAMVLIKEDQLVELGEVKTEAQDKAENNQPAPDQTSEKPSKTGVFVGIGVAIVIVLGALLAFFLRKK